MFTPEDSRVWNPSTRADAGPNPFTPQQAHVDVLGALRSTQHSSKDIYSAHKKDRTAGNGGGQPHRNHAGREMFGPETYSGYRYLSPGHSTLRNDYDRVPQVANTLHGDRSAVMIDSGAWAHAKSRARGQLLANPVGCPPPPTDSLASPSSRMAGMSLQGSPRRGFRVPVLASASTSPRRNGPSNRPSPAKKDARRRDSDGDVAAQPPPGHEVEGARPGTAAEDVAADPKTDGLSAAGDVSDVDIANKNLSMFEEIHGGPSEHSEASIQP